MSPQLGQAGLCCGNNNSNLGGLSQQKYISCNCYIPIIGHQEVLVHGGQLKTQAHLAVTVLNVVFWVRENRELWRCLH